MRAHDGDMFDDEEDYSMPPFDGTAVNHTPSTHTTTRDGRRFYKVTCSCGHIIITTDSERTATHMKNWHTTTAECPYCHHRNIHGGVGCTYDNGVPHTCPCTHTVTNT
jgi:hypothetical protein